MEEGKREWGLDLGLAGLDFLIALIVYLRTMARSVPFWDCGEFIACSYILGVPHPPGTPLFVLLGRLFTFLPIFGSVARRVNFISSLFSAGTVAFAYLFISEVVKLWSAELRRGWRQIIPAAGGIVGSLFMAFSDTYWFNSTEAEVYGVAMFLMVFLTWLALRWYQSWEKPQGDRLLFLMIYLLFMGIGFHMTVFLAAPALLLLIVLVDRGKAADFRFWLAVVPLAFVAYSESINPFFVLSGLALVISLLMSWSTTGEKRKHWRFGFWLVFIALLGYSNNIYIPVRSHLNPRIDENDPANWTRFKMFLERKQYGKTGMMKGMFTRKGTWAHQFGVYRHMGFWGFFRHQYTPPKFWILPVILGLIGMPSLLKRRRRLGIFLFSLLFIGTIGLILYMNFSDGTKGVRLEVRDRDYFYTPGFVYFALWIGIGVSAILEWLRARLKNFRNGSRGMVGFASLLLLATPVIPFLQNYHIHDRSGNYIAHDYAYNMLESCDPNGIIFTNGDNDTFPLWYIQEVEGVRKDVRVVNLSLLNTPWYILQLKHQEPKVPISLSDEQIERLMAYRLKNGKIIRVQDIMVQDIITTNKWKKPIFFAVTVSDDNKVGLQDYLRMEGLVYRLVSEKKPHQIDAEKMHHNLWDVYKFTGLADPKVYKNENMMKLLANYTTAFVFLAFNYDQDGKPDKAVAELRRCMEVLPGDFRPYELLAQIYVKGKQFDKALAVVQEEEEKWPHRLENYVNLAMIQHQLGKDEEAIGSLKRSLEIDPDFKEGMKRLIGLYLAAKKDSEALSQLEEWVGRHPDDRGAKGLLQNLLNKGKADTAHRGGNS